MNLSSVYSSKIEHAARLGDLSLAVSTFEYMVEKSLTPSQSAFLGLVEIHSKRGLFPEAYQYFQLMCNKFKIVPKPITCANMLHVCPLEYLDSIFEVMTSKGWISARNERSYLNLYVRAFDLGAKSEIDKYYNKMLAAGCTPTFSTYNAILSRAMVKGEEEIMRKYLTEMISRNIFRTELEFLTEASWALIYLKDDKVHSKIRSLRDHQRRHVQKANYTRLVVLFSSADDHSNAESYYEEMKSLDILSQKATCSLSLCLSRAGKVNSLERLWNEVLRTDLITNTLVLTSFAESFTRVGQIDKCDRMFAKIPLPEGKLEEMEKEARNSLHTTILSHFISKNDTESLKKWQSKIVASKIINEEAVKRVCDYYDHLEDESSKKAFLSSISPFFDLKLIG